MAFLATLEAGVSLSALREPLVLLLFWPTWSERIESHDRITIAIPLPGLMVRRIEVPLAAVEGESRDLLSPWGRLEVLPIRILPAICLQFTFLLVCEDGVVMIPSGNVVVWKSLDSSSNVCSQAAFEEQQHVVF